MGFCPLLSPSKRRRQSDGSEVNEAREGRPTAEAFPSSLGRTKGNEAREERPTAKAFPSP
ncbi:hypothetical protein HMPREF1556_01544 [Porphyromonas sp. oral taxon 278 str. W7784]|nr:hypothetical protein HMPREF1556_01544 [Porphyromonas sp. oral taxon 278 str. W7784]